MITLPASFANVYAKTDLGQHEMRTRVLGLKPASRRLLVLVDGKRSGRELSTLLVGQDTDATLSDLLSHGCIELVAAVATTAARLPAASRGEPGLAGLPAPQLRSPDQVEMARHFMINTVNMMFGQNMRLSLIEAISNCSTTEALRAVYPLWLESMSGNRSAVKRLPELRSKLFAVL